MFDNIMLSPEDVCVWLNISRHTLITLVQKKRFPPPVVLATSPVFVLGTPIRWFRYEIEDWLSSAPRMGGDGYLEMMLTPERLAAYRARLPDGDMMLTVNEVCQWLAIVPSSLYRFLKREEYRFPRPYSLDPVATKMVSTARFRKSEIEAWLKTLPRRIGTARIPNAPGST